MRLLFLALLLPSFAIAQILAGSSFIAVNKDINFASNAITNNQICGHNLCIGVYPCTTEVIDIDFSVQNSMVFVCVCPCVAAVVASPRPFYISKKDFFALNLVTPLVLSDTSAFIKVDTLQYLSKCTLPFYNKNASNLSVLTAVVKTHLNKFVLIKAEQVIVTIPQYSGAMSCWGKTYFGGYNVQWFLQQNGTSDFSGVDQSNIISRYISVSKVAAVDKPASSEAYNILGQRIHFPVGSQRRNGGSAKMIVIKRQEGRMHLLLTDSK